jgi:hypothetical protein
MPSYTPPCLFSDHVGIFPTMWEFFQPCPISKEEFFPLCRNFSYYDGIFPNSHPICRKNPLLVDRRDPRSISCIQWVALKIFLLLQRESSVICKAISRKSAETISFFLQCRSGRDSFLKENFMLVYL